MKPSEMFRPSVTQDGDTCRALLGPDVDNGVAGFGPTPEEALADFDRAWSSAETPSALYRRAALAKQHLDSISAAHSEVCQAIKQDMAGHEMRFKADVPEDDIRRAQTWLRTSGQFPFLCENRYGGRRAPEPLFDKAIADIASGPLVLRTQFIGTHGPGDSEFERIADYGRRPADDDTQFAISLRFGRRQEPMTSADRDACMTVLAAIRDKRLPVSILHESGLA